MGETRHVVLMGLMGAGKSSVGSALARLLDRPLHDNDDDLRRRTGRTGREIAATHGVERLHAEEAATLLDALARPEPAVIGAAASVVCLPEVRSALAGHVVVWLREDLDVLARKVDDAAHRRVVGDDPLAALQEQLAERGPCFEAVATIVVDRDSRPGAAVARTLVDRVEEALR